MVFVLSARSLLTFFYLGLSPGLKAVISIINNPFSIRMQGFEEEIEPFSFSKKWENEIVFGIFECEPELR